MSRGRAALITGAARRVGRAIALQLAREGWDIGLHYLNSEAEARAAAAEIEALGVRCRIYSADLARAEASRPLIGAFCADFPTATLLVNNASTYVHDNIDTLTPDQWRRQIEVNTLAPILLARAFHAAIRERGCVVNLLDHKIVNLTPDYFSYTVSKAALHAATIMLAMAFAPKTRVNGIAPGLLLPSGSLSERQFAKLHARAPLGRGATPADVAEAVSYLARAEAMTGAVLVLDGGGHFERKLGEADLPTEEA